MTDPVTPADLGTHEKAMSPYEFQRWVFRMAQKHGWQGKEPSVLGGHRANEAFQSALRFLQAQEDPREAGDPPENPRI